MSQGRRTHPLPPHWNRTRRRILTRDQHLCQLVYDGCVGTATQVDHIVPAHLGGTDHDDNLQATCTPCHQQKTRAEIAAATARRNHLRHRPTAPHPGLVT